MAIGHPVAHTPSGPSTRFAARGGHQANARNVAMRGKGIVAMSNVVVTAWKRALHLLHTTLWTQDMRCQKVSYFCSSLWPSRQTQDYAQLLSQVTIVSGPTFLRYRTVFETLLDSNTSERLHVPPKSNRVGVLTVNSSPNSSKWRPNYSSLPAKSFR